MLGAADNPLNLPPGFEPPGGGAATRPEHCAAGRRYIGACSRFLSRYRYVLEAHPVEFLIQKPMERLPEAWLAELASPGMEDELDLGVLLGEQPAAPAPAGAPAGAAAGAAGDLSSEEGGDGGGLLGFFRAARGLQMLRRPSVELVADEKRMQPLAQELRMFTNPKKVRETETIQSRRAPSRQLFSQFRASLRKLWAGFQRGAPLSFD